MVSAERLRLDLGICLVHRARSEYLTAAGLLDCVGKRTGARYASTGLTGLMNETQNGT